MHLVLVLPVLSSSPKAALAHQAELIWKHPSDPPGFATPLGYDPNLVLLDLIPGATHTLVRWHYPSGNFEILNVPLEIAAGLFQVSEDGTMFASWATEAELVVTDTRTGDEIRRVPLPSDPDCQVTIPGILPRLSQDFSRGVIGSREKLCILDGVTGNVLAKRMIRIEDHFSPPPEDADNIYIR